MTSRNPRTSRKVEMGSDELVERARLGDAVAFSELVAIHQHEVYTLALRLVGNRTLAADVSQEALIRAWRAMPRFRGDAAFGTWLHRITVNAAWTQRSKAKRHLSTDLDAVEDRPDPVMLNDPALAGERLEMRGRLSAAIAQLSETQRAVVVLKDVYGWSHAEISEALSISVTAAKVRLHRAHQRLRDLLRESV